MALPALASYPPPAVSQPLDTAALPLPAADFERVRRLIHQRAGIHLQSGKEAMVHSRLSRLLREHGLPSFAAYLDELERSGTEPMWQQFVNALTTNLTSFFREEHHFTALAELLRHKAQGVRVWCNAASTGEEPYSLAMVLAESLPANAPFSLLCTDIDTQVLATARRGVYPADARGLSPERLKRHFLRGTGANAGQIRIKPDLAKRLSFEPFNLIGNQWGRFTEPFDIVFCRNVMIYFDATTQKRVLAAIHQTLKPGGLLFAGHSENFSDEKQLFKSRGKTMYERL
jgi:chemotaxis protein methyltransferase CheR